MALIKNEIPILEYDTEEHAVLMPGGKMKLWVYWESSYVVYGTRDRWICYKSWMRARWEIWECYKNIFGL